MSEQEMLELAAKAAGIVLLDRQEAHAFGHGVITTGGHWSPIHDDGDALRLAVRLGIAIQLHPAWVYARAVMPNDHYKWIEITEGYGNGGDPCAATRLAIVRAAAETGRYMS